MMLRKIRISLALVCFTLVVLLFADFTGFSHRYFAWIAKVQFIPAVLAVNVFVFSALLLLTLLFGRIYCLIICPLGVWQDVVSWFSKRRKTKKHKPFCYTKPLTWLRWAVAAVFVGLFVAGLGFIADLIEPYSAFGRIAANVFTPIYHLINNGLAFVAEKADSYAFYSTDIWFKGGTVLLVAVLTLLVVSILAWKKGRLYCNTVCPVGTVLGIASRFAIFKPIINLERCNSCGLCALKCKSQCINSKEHKIDYSRCVLCFDCMEVCNKKAMKYKFAFSRSCNENHTDSQPIDRSKRDFLTVSALVATTAALRAQESAVDGGLAVIEDKKIPSRSTLLVPPTAQSQKHFFQHCTACQLCVSACPNGVLRPSTSLKHFMQPEMQYERGYCRPECTRCGDVCPTGAIQRITVEEKSSLKLGTARWISDNCVVMTDEVSCLNCERHCPTGAISHVPLDINQPRGLQIPAVDEERCIGCGACENLCPARPFSAIYVEGDAIQRFL